MKKRFAALCAMSLALLATGCSDMLGELETLSKKDAKPDWSWTVTFDGQGATVDASPISKTVRHPATHVDALPSAPAKTGSFFAGWWTEASGGGSEFTAVTAVTADLTVYAKWSPVPAFIVTFDSSGGSAVAPQTVLENAFASEPPDPTKDGYDFAGWYIDPAFSAPFAFSSTPITGALTLYAKWSAHVYSIVYDLAGGTQNPGNPATYTIADRGFSFLPPSRDKYLFGGWFADADCKTHMPQIPVNS